MDARGRDELFPGVEDTCLHEQTEKLQSLAHVPLGKAEQHVAIPGPHALMLNQVRACFQEQRPDNSMWLRS